MNLILLLKDYFYRRKNNPPLIYDERETIDCIIKDKLSVSRFGDGELDMLLNINHPKFQKADVELVRKLNETFYSKNKNLLVCIPNVFTTDRLNLLTNKAARHWKRFLMHNRKRLYQFLITIEYMVMFNLQDII